MNVGLHEANTLAEITARLEQPLTVLEAAIDLYNRGLNVIPIPRPKEVQAWAAARPDKYDPLSKPPYILRPFFLSHLHLCGRECREREAKTGRRCLSPDASFDALFTDTNLAVMTGRTSGNLVDIDCDSIESFQRIRTGLDYRCIPYWSFTSSRGGGFLLRVAEGEVNNVPKSNSLFQDVEVWGRMHMIVLPPSLHPQGVFYQWATPDPYHYLSPGESPPLVGIKELEWLGVKLILAKRESFASPDLFGLPEWTASLSLPNRKFLSSGATEGERNQWLTRAAYDMAGNEIAYSEAEYMLLLAARKCSPPYSETDARDILKSAYRKKRQPARKGYIFAPNPWRTAQEFAETFDWHVFGRLAQTARATFLACIERSYHDDSAVFRASEREISEIAIFGEHERARTGLQILSSRPVLHDSPLLKWVGTSSVSGANLYRFTDAVLQYSNPLASAHLAPINPSLAVCSGGKMSAPKQLLPRTPEEKDVFSKFHLGGWLIWRHLCERPEFSAAAVANSEFIPSSSVRRILQKQLIPFGFVAYDSGTKLYVGLVKTRAELEQIADRLGVRGSSEKRNRKHKREREIRLNIQVARARLRWSRLAPRSMDGQQEHAAELLDLFSF